MRGKKPIVLSRETKKRAIASLQRYLVEEMDVEAGNLKTEMMLDFIVAEVGPTLYNLAIADARQFFQERTADLDGICYQGEFPYWPGPARR